MKASDFRAIAREKLSGKWGLAVASLFVASLLGATYGGPSINFRFDTDDFEKLFQNSGVFGDAEFSLSTIDQINTSMPWLLPLIAAVVTLFSMLAMISFVLGGVMKLGACTFCKNLVRSGEAKFNDIFANFDIFGKAFVTNLLLSIFISLWFVLLIVPGIIMSFAYSMTFYILEENPSMSPMDAIRASRELMKGHKWELFCLQFSFIGWSILAALTAGIGGLFLSPYMLTAEYAFYDHIAHGTTVEKPESAEYGYVPVDGGNN